MTPVNCFTVRRAASPTAQVCHQKTASSYDELAHYRLYQMRIAGKLAFFSGPWGIHEQLKFKSTGLKWDQMEEREGGYYQSYSLLPIRAIPVHKYRPCGCQFTLIRGFKEDLFEVTSCWFNSKTDKTKDIVDRFSDAILRYKLIIDSNICKFNPKIRFWSRPSISIVRGLMMTRNEAWMRRFLTSFSGKSAL